MSDQPSMGCGVLEKLFEAPWSPQTHTRPPASSAIPWLSPAAMETMPDRLGTSCGRRMEFRFGTPPQPQTLPLASSASEWLEPSAMAVIGGGALTRDGRGGVFSG